MFTFLLDASRTGCGHAPTAFMAFFVYVWTVWVLKALAARRYRPVTGSSGDRTTTVLVPVYREPEDTFRRVLASVRAQRPTELIAIVDGRDPEPAEGAGQDRERLLGHPDG